MILYFFYGSGMCGKHPNHTYERNRNNSGNNWASLVPSNSQGILENLKEKTFAVYTKLNVFSFFFILFKYIHSAVVVTKVFFKLKMQPILKDL